MWPLGPLSTFRDRFGGSVQEGVLHGVIHSFVNVEEYKKKAPLKVSSSEYYNVYYEFSLVVNWIVCVILKGQFPSSFSSVFAVNLFMIFMTP